MLHATKAAGLTLLVLFLISHTAFAVPSEAQPATGIDDTEPVDGSWQTCTNIPWQVQEVYGTTRDGKVIIAGGMALSEADTPIGLDHTGIYDPATNAWTKGPALPAARHHPLLVSAGGRIYALGGATQAGAGGHWQARQEVYVLERAGDWGSLTPMPAPQTEAMAVEYEGRIHIIGGRTPNFDDASHWSEYRDVDWHYVYDIQTDTWSKAAPLPSARNSAAVTIIDGLIYVAGGRTMKGGNMASLDRYDPATDRWESLSPMPHASGGLNGGAVGGQFYVFGGEELGVRGADGVFSHALRYNPATNKWQALPDMPTPRHGHAVASVQGVLFTVGGGAHTATGEPTATLEAFTPGGNYRGLSCHED